MANNDGHFALMSSDSFADQWVEIALGGWKNTKSVLVERYGDRKGKLFWAIYA